MTEKKTDLKRDGTMQVTAKEGVRFLKDAGEKTLLALQGLDTDDAEAQKPRMKRDSTMAVTAKEGKRFLEGDTTLAPELDVAPEVEVAKRGRPPKGDQSPVKPKLAKFTTMLQTKKEGEAFLSSKGGLDNDDLQDDEETSPKKLKLANEKADNKKPQVKRVSTLVKTAKEGEELLKGLGHKDDNPDSERRRTRSQTRRDSTPAPPPKSEKKRESVKEAPSNGGKRGRKGRPRKDEKKPVEAAEDSKSTDEENADEEDEAKAEADEKEEAAPQKKGGATESVTEGCETIDTGKGAQGTDN